MLLALDIGNTRIKGGFFEGTTLGDTFFVDVARNGEWESRLRDCLRDRAADRVALCSVVPAREQKVRRLVERLLRTQDGGPDVLSVHYDMTLPFSLAYETPETVGNDRLAAAAAGWELFGRARKKSVIVIDTGTAVTYEVIDKDGTYRGGAIAPGPRMLAAALHGNTAQLPELPLTIPPHVIGNSTEMALQSGIFYGFADSVAGMIRRFNDSLGESAVVVATGGDSDLLQQAQIPVNHHSPLLVLRGIQLLAALNPSP